MVCIVIFHCVTVQAENRGGCSASWPPDASSALSVSLPPPPTPPRKPGLPDDFCRPPVREYNLWVVPVLNLKRTPVGAIIVDAQGGGVRGWGDVAARNEGTTQFND